MFVKKKANKGREEAYKRGGPVVGLPVAGKERKEVQTDQGAVSKSGYLKDRADYRCVIDGIEEQDHHEEQQRKTNMQLVAHAHNRGGISLTVLLFIKI